MTNQTYQAEAKAIALKVYLIAVLLTGTTSITAFSREISWNFLSTGYQNSPNDQPIAEGVLITSDVLDSGGRYDILSISGFYGKDAIVGLSNRSSRLWDSKFPGPDNGVSINSMDATNGCQGIQPMGGMIPHFSCEGLSFVTTVGLVNLAFGGATSDAIGYNGEFIMARNTIVQNISAVPEPETYAMLLAGLGLIGAAVKRRKAEQA